MKNATDITIILDRSGSMDSIKSDTIGGVNSFLADQRAAPGAASITLVQFDHEYEVVYAGRPISDAPSLTPETFVPRGNTALLDAMGRTIVATGERLAALSDTDRPDKIIVVIITDGQENASREYTKAKIDEMVRHQTDAYRWLFVYLGANQDAISVAHAMGISQANAMNYAANAGGVAASYDIASANIRSRRIGSVAGSADFFTDEDRERQKKADTSKKPN